MGMALCVLASPMPASAAESSVLMASGGVASVLEMERSLEEYIQIAQDAQGASWGYTNIGVANVESGNLNIRAVPSTDGKLVGKLPKDAACEVIETKDGWCHIKSGEVDGYVSREFLHTGPEATIRAAQLVHTVAIANTDGLNAVSYTHLKGLLAAYPEDRFTMYTEADAAFREQLAGKAPGERLYIAGSLYLVGEIKESLDHDQF